MKKTILFTVAISSCFLLNSFAEDNDISKKEKKQLIDIFGGKVEKKEIPNDTKKPETSRETDKAKFKEAMKKQEAEMQAKIQNMTREERKKFKQEIDKRRQQVKEKMKNMTDEERAAFIKEMKQNRRGKTAN